MASTAGEDPFELHQRTHNGVTPGAISGGKADSDDIPSHLQNAALRLEFPPSYALVGIYRLLTDPDLYKPAWQKCRNGTIRGVVVGIAWVLLTFNIQKGFVKLFLKNSPRITGLSDDTVFGFKIPFNVHTYAALLYAGHQMTTILSFFLSKNMRIARDRAWEYTVQSRLSGMSHESRERYITSGFWRPYVEEWANPPRIDAKKNKKGWRKWMGGRVGLFVIKQLLVIPAGLYPLLGPLASAWIKALGTGGSLHRRYFESKKMTQDQIEVFIEERKWDYRSFGFTAALLEGLPIVGLVFMISNRVGAAMWAFDLEKRQHYIAEKREAQQGAKR